MWLFKSRLFAAWNFAARMFSGSAIVAEFGFVQALGLDGECIIARAFTGETLRGPGLVDGDTGPVVCARIVSEPDESGEQRPLVRYDVASATVWAGTHDGTGEAATVLTGWNDKADAIDLDEAITAALPWVGNYLGYNFAWQIPAELLDLVSVGEWLVVSIAITLDSGDVCRVRFTARKVDEG